MWLMRRRTYKYMSFEILRVIRQSLPRCFYDHGGYANAQIVLMKFLCLFFICVRFCCWMPVGFRFGLFFVGGYVATILWGLCAVHKKRVFGPKTAKIMKIALFWPQNFEKMADFCGFAAIFWVKKWHAHPARRIYAIITRNFV